MSRHEIPLAGGRELVVGWDPPLETYFAVLRTPEHAHPVLWVGTEPYELDDLAALGRALGRHREHLTPDLELQLYRDRDEGA